LRADDDQLALAGVQATHRVEEQHDGGPIEHFGRGVHLVLDNSSTHKTPAIQRWLAAHPRFVLHFTPTSSSRLNLVERWFAELTTKRLRRGAHRSVGALNADIRAWIETWNDDPKPFVWTKTADQILESIARYCQRINDSRH
jgi:transposase